MLVNFDQWSRRVNFPKGAAAPLGFGGEYWKTDPRLYEGFEQLNARLRGLGRKARKTDVAYQLTSNLLGDMLVAAGGVENSVVRLRAAIGELKAYVLAHELKAANGIQYGLSHPAAITSWYAFSDLLTWSRTVVERMEHRAGNRKKFPMQGLLPALKPVRLRKRCEKLLATLSDGPVGQSRNLANFVLHTALVQHPLSGVQIDATGLITLPVPDLPSQLTSHWYLLTWDREQDGIVLAEEIWDSVRSFLDALIDAFEKSVPKRLRRTFKHEASN